MALKKRQYQTLFRFHWRWAARGAMFAWAVTMGACQWTPAVQTEGEGPSGIIEGSERLQFSGWVKALGFSQGGKKLIAGGCDAENMSKDGSCIHGQVRIWNVRDSALELTVAFPRTITALAVSPNGMQWMAGDVEGRLIPSHKSTKISSPPVHQKGEITALAYSPDGKWVASGSLDASFPLGLVEVKTGGVVKVKAAFDPVSAVAFAPVGKDLAIGMTNGAVVVWDVMSSSSPVKIVPGSAGDQAVTALAFSLDGMVLAYGRQDGKVAILERRTGQLLMDIERGATVRAMSFSPDGQYLALGQDNGKAVLVSVEKAREVWSKRHVLPVSDLAYSPDGTSLAVAAQQQVYLYRLGEVSGASGTLPQDRQRSGTRMQLTPGSGSRGGTGFQSASRKFKDILGIAQEEYWQLLPFDRLTVAALGAMQAVVPGAVAERHGSAMPGQLTLSAGRRSMSIDLNRLRKAEGRAGVRETVQTVEAAQQLLAGAWPGSETILENAAVMALLAELGPGLRLMPQREMESFEQAKKDSGNGALRGGFMASSQGADEAVVGDDIRYFKLANFNRSTARQVQRWLTRGASVPGKAPAYILDLRDNNGLDLDSVVATADWLLPKGQTITELIARKTGDRIEYRSKSLMNSPGAVVVLVNERTAGTAELLACAIRESGVGVLVGTKTAGIDEVYGLFPLVGGEVLRVSTGRFYCPGGRSLRWKGQPVDVEVPRAFSSGAVAIGASHPESFPRSHRASQISASVPVMADSQLQVGIEVAMCLRQSQIEKFSPYHPAKHAESAVGLLGACPANPR